MEYTNGKIYQILNNVNDEVYVGSTTQPLGKRLYKHQHGSKNRDNLINKLIREIGEDSIYIELIETYPCNSKEELYARGTLNKKIEGRTSKEWFEGNKDILKQYRENNKEHIKEVKKQYYETNKDNLKNIITNTHI